MDPDKLLELRKRMLEQNRSTFDEGVRVGVAVAMDTFRHNVGGDEISCIVERVEEAISKQIPIIGDARYQEHVADLKKART